MPTYIRGKLTENEEKNMTNNNFDIVNYSPDVNLQKIKKKGIKTHTQKKCVEATMGE